VELLKTIKSHILEDEFKLIFTTNKLNVISYDNIDHFNNNKIMIRYDNNIVTVKGSNLVVSKLLNEEILIEGKINNIEFR